MNKERERLILERLVRDKRVDVKTLAAEIYASEQSIRRDLQSLEKQGLIKRVHGGAILEETPTSRTKIPFLLRELEQSDAKILIAKKAAALVRDGDTILLDGSSSAYTLIPFLTARNDLTIITNGLKAIVRAGEYGINAYSTGGHLLPSCAVLVGEEAHRTLRSFQADICFFSCRGLRADGWATDISVEEDTVRQKMLAQSRVKVLLCDSGKIGKSYMHTTCHADDLDYIIADKPLPDGLTDKECKEGE